MPEELVQKIERKRYKELEKFYPDPKLVVKIIVEITLGFVFTIGIIYGFVALIHFESDMSLAEVYLIMTPWMLGITAPIYLVSIAFVKPYVNAISYVLTTHEIIVNKGIITKSRKVVPYRNITNFITKRGPFDRLIGGSDFGTIAIETAGQSGQQQHPEQQLIGIKNTTEYTEKLRDILSKMKGQAAVTADTQIAPALEEEELLSQILATLKDIAEKI
ncbi:MAG: PH domain-containing protein [Candidatus Heimdallarchaeaceae archaeon]